MKKLIRLIVFSLALIPFFNFNASPEVSNNYKASNFPASIIKTISQTGVTQGDCNIYEWLLKDFDENYNEYELNTTWKICSDKIEFVITNTTVNEFFFRGVVLEQNGIIFGTSFSESDLIAKLDCPHEIKPDVTIRGQITELPSCFDIYSPFKIIYGYGENIYLEVEGAPGNPPPPEPQTECNEYLWLLKKDSYKGATSLWSICPYKIEFKVAALDIFDDFFLCGCSIVLVQNGNQYECSDFSHSYYGGSDFDGCDYIDQFDGTITNRITEWTDKFDIFSPFRIYYDTQYIDVEGSPPAPPEKPCLATSLYGENSSEVKLLKIFRDNVLSKTSKGREIIKLYYELSPLITKILQNNAGFKKDTKIIFDKLLTIIENQTR